MRVRPLAAASLLALVSGASSAHAQEESRSVAEGVRLTNSLRERRHTIAELEAGILALPNAPISNANAGGATPLGKFGKGDATVQVGVHLLLRAAPDWAFGATALFCPLPTIDDAYDSTSGLRRTHQRSYLQLGGEARYIPLHFDSFDVWIGGTFGGVVVADRFVTNSIDPESGVQDDVPPLIGRKEVTIRTEGIAFGAELGTDWLIAERLEAGLTLRLDEWILPRVQACSPIGDCSTLNGSVTALEVGLKFGYRLPL